MASVGGALALMLMTVGTTAALAVSTFVVHQTALITAAAAGTATANRLSAACRIPAATHQTALIAAATTAIATANSLSAACRIPTAVILAPLHNHNTTKRKSVGRGTLNRFVG